VRAKFASAGGSHERLMLDEGAGRTATPARSFKFRELAAFLFDQVILNSAAIFRCFENIFPLCSPFPKQHL